MGQTMVLPAVSTAAVVAAVEVPQAMVDVVLLALCA